MPKKKILPSRFTKGLRILHSVIQTGKSLPCYRIEYIYKLEKITKIIEEKLLGDLL